MEEAKQNDKAEEGERRSDLIVSYRGQTYPIMPLDPALTLQLLTEDISTKTVTKLLYVPPSRGMPESGVRVACVEYILFSNLPSTTSLFTLPICMLCVNV